ncbi:GRAM domain-containing protein 3-like isoform X1 [Arapaima gigas]
MLGYTSNKGKPLMANLPRKLNVLLPALVSLPAAPPADLSVWAQRVGAGSRLRQGCSHMRLCARTSGQSGESSSKPSLRLPPPMERTKIPWHRQAPVDAPDPPAILDGASENKRHGAAPIVGGWGLDVKAAARVKGYSVLPQTASHFGEHDPWHRQEATRSSRSPLQILPRAFSAKRALPYHASTAPGCTKALLILNMRHKPQSRK